MIIEGGAKIKKVERVKVNCGWCGKEKDVRITEYNPEKTYFCSRECTWKFFKKTPVSVYIGKEKEMERRRKISKSTKGKQLSEETKKKIGEANKVKLKVFYQSEEGMLRRKQISESQKGRPSPTKGKTWEEIYGAEQAEVLKKRAAERLHTPEVLRKQGEKKKGRSLNHKEDCQCGVCKAKRGEFKGENNPFWGKTHSRETIERILNSEGYKNRNKYNGVQAMLNKIEELKRDPEWYRRWRENIKKSGGGRGIKGYYFSKKNNCELRYESLYELAFYMQLESDSKVLRFSRCGFDVAYELDGEEKIYEPDVFVEYRNGDKEVCEVKSSWVLENKDARKKFLAKLVALRDYCSERNWKYRFVTEKDLGLVGRGYNEFRKLLEMKEV